MGQGMGTPPRLLIPVLGLMFAAPSMSSPSNAYRWLRRGPLACGVVAAALGASGLAPLAGGPQAPWLAVGSGIALLALGIAVASAGTRRAGAKTLAWLAAFASLGAAALVFEPATSLTHPSTPVAIVAAFIGAGVLATLGGAADLFPEVLEREGLFEPPQPVLLLVGPAASYRERARDLLRLHASARFPPAG